MPSSAEAGQGEAAVEELDPMLDPDGFSDSASDSDLELHHPMGAEEGEEGGGGGGGGEESSSSPLLIGVPYAGRAAHVAAESCDGKGGKGHSSGSGSPAAAAAAAGGSSAADHDGGAAPASSSAAAASSSGAASGGAVLTPAVPEDADAISSSSTDSGTKTPAAAGGGGGGTTGTTAGGTGGTGTGTGTGRPSVAATPGIPGLASSKRRLGASGPQHHPNTPHHQRTLSDERASYGALPDPSMVLAMRQQEQEREQQQQQQLQAQQEQLQEEADAAAESERPKLRKGRSSSSHHSAASSSSSKSYSKDGGGGGGAATGGGGGGKEDGNGGRSRSSQSLVLDRTESKLSVATVASAATAESAAGMVESEAVAGARRAHDGMTQAEAAARAAVAASALLAANGGGAVGGGGGGAELMDVHLGAVQHEELRVPASVTLAGVSVRSTAAQILDTWARRASVGVITDNDSAQAIQRKLAQFTILGRSDDRDPRANLAGAGLRLSGGPPPARWTRIEQADLAAPALCEYSVGSHTSQASSSIGGSPRMGRRGTDGSEIQPVRLMIVVENGHPGVKRLLTSPERTLEEMTVFHGLDLREALAATDSPDGSGGASDGSPQPRGGGVRRAGKSFRLKSFRFPSSSSPATPREDHDESLGSGGSSVGSSEGSAAAAADHQVRLRATSRGPRLVVPKASGGSGGAGNQGGRAGGAVVVGDDSAERTEPRRVRSSSLGDESDGLAGRFSASLPVFANSGKAHPRARHRVEADGDSGVDVDDFSVAGSSDGEDGAAEIHRGDHVYHTADAAKSKTKPEQQQQQQQRKGGGSKKSGGSRLGPTLSSLSRSKHSSGSIGTKESDDRHPRRAPSAPNPSRDIPKKGRRDKGGRRGRADRSASSSQSYSSSLDSDDFDRSSEEEYDGDHHRHDCREHHGDRHRHHHRRHRDYSSSEDDDDGHLYEDYDDYHDDDDDDEEEEDDRGPRRAASHATAPAAPGARLQVPGERKEPAAGGGRGGRGERDSRGHDASGRSSPRSTAQTGRNAHSDSRYQDDRLAAKQRREKTRLQRELSSSGKLADVAEAFSSSDDDDDDDDDRRRRRRRGGLLRGSDDRRRDRRRQQRDARASGGGDGGVSISPAKRTTVGAAQASPHQKRVPAHIAARQMQALSQRRLEAVRGTNRGGSGGDSPRGAAKRGAGRDRRHHRGGRDSSEPESDVTTDSQMSSSSSSEDDDDDEVYSSEDDHEPRRSQRRMPSLYSSGSSRGSRASQEAAAERERERLRALGSRTSLIPVGGRNAKFGVEAGDLGADFARSRKGSGSGSGEHSKRGRSGSSSSSGRAAAHGGGSSSSSGRASPAVLEGGPPVRRGRTKSIGGASASSRRSVGSSGSNRR